MKRYFFLLWLTIVNLSALGQDIKIAPIFGPNVTFPGYSRELRKSLKTDLVELLDEAGVQAKFNVLPAIRMQIGGMIDYSLSEALSLQSGLIFNLRGYTFKMNLKGSGGSGKFSGKVRLSYLELPLWGAYRIGKSGFSVSLGPTFGVVLGGKEHGKSTINGKSESESQSFSIGNKEGVDNLKPLDISFNLGIAKQISVGEHPLEVSLNIQPSLTKWTVNNTSDYYGRYVTASVRVAYFSAVK